MTKDASQNPAKVERVHYEHHLLISIEWSQLYWLAFRPLAFGCCKSLPPFFGFCQRLSQAPHTFVCAPAVALIFSSRGEVEVFSSDQKCNQKVVDAEFPPFAGHGRSLDLLDEQLVLIGNSKRKLGGKFEYISIQKPRKGLLGMKFTTEVAPIGYSPFWHTSHSFGNQLLALGGVYRSKVRLSNTVWNGLDLHWQNTTKFSRFATGACTVKLIKDIFLVIGGSERVRQKRLEMDTVLKLNIEEESVEELPPIKLKRAFHACEVSGTLEASDLRILISGGTKGKDLVADEIYHWSTKDSVVLDPASSLGRQKHRLLRLEDKIFSFGGLQSDGSETSVVQWFDWDNTRWNDHESPLLSKSTGNLAVTAFPLSAVDCHAGCSCGLAGSLGRIVGGSEAEVRKWLANSFHCLYLYICR